MSKLFIPKGYSSALSLYQTQTAIGRIKEVFSSRLAAALNLTRATAPLFVDPKTGLNDNLNGVERPVSFDIKETGTTAEVVHSLAKWKRMALHKYGFSVGEGLYTDMNAIRRDEEMDNLHSIYVDQWDWEAVVERKQRTEEFLKDTVVKIIDAVCDTYEALTAEFSALKVAAPCRDVSFVTTQQLEDMYPALTAKEREHEYLKAHKTAFIMQIGGVLRSGKKHDGRAPDYDDWALNGDIMFWHPVLECALEISSMGIRVDERSLDLQLTAAGCDDRRGLDFHRALLNGELPLTMGGGIGQSRLCMLLLNKVHIGEVQTSIWDKKTLDGCKKAGIEIL